MGNEDSTLGRDGLRLFPYILDVGFRWPDRPKEGQWAKWRTPCRIVVTTTPSTIPIETWYWKHFATILEEFSSDFE